jgi:hypothetical protein
LQLTIDSILTTTSQLCVNNTSEHFHAAIQKRLNQISAP